MALVAKNLLPMQVRSKRRGFNPWVSQEDPLEEDTATTPIFLPGEFHEQRSLVGYSPWSHKKSDMTEQLTLSLLHGETRTAEVFQIK